LVEIAVVVQQPRIERRLVAARRIGKLKVAVVHVSRKVAFVGLDQFRLEIIRLRYIYPTKQTVLQTVIGAVQVAQFNEYLGAVATAGERAVFKKALAQRRKQIGRLDLFLVVFNANRTAHPIFSKVVFDACLVAQEF